MFGKGLKLFTIFGFEVRIDATWLILAILIIVTLTTGHFPRVAQNLSTGTYILMGIGGLTGLFFSIVFHEFWHSVIARSMGIEMRGISLFMFGGVAQMGEESHTPKSEFFMAIAGPIASVVLGVIFYGIYRLGGGLNWPLPVNAVVGYLALINVILAAFNMLPAFPLDGGRVLRSILWAVKRNQRWATRIASQIGGGFGLALILLGILSMLGGVLVGGLWWCLLGLFLRGISHSSYQQVLISQTLKDEKVERLMHKEPLTVRETLPLEDLVENYIYEHHYKMFPVVDDSGNPQGFVTTRQVRDVARQQWRQTKVGDVMTPIDENNVLAPDIDATEAFKRMRRTQNTRLLVVEDGDLVGILTLKDMLDFLSTKLDLEGDETGAAEIGRRLDQ